MRQIYTNESYVLAIHSRNRLEAEGVYVELKNEFTSGAAVGGHSIWPELWVKDSDYERAIKILEASPVDEELDDWICQKCEENNPGNFNICWKCQANSQQGATVGTKQV